MRTTAPVPRRPRCHDLLAQATCSPQPPLSDESRCGAPHGTPGVRWRSRHPPARRRRRARRPARARPGRRARRSARRRRRARRARGAVGPGLHAEPSARSGRVWVNDEVAQGRPRHGGAPRADPTVTTWVRASTSTTYRRSPTATPRPRRCPTVNRAMPSWRPTSRPSTSTTAPGRAPARASTNPTRSRRATKQHVHALGLVGGPETDGAGSVPHLRLGELTHWEHQVRELAAG